MVASLSSSFVTAVAPAAVVGATDDDASSSMFTNNRPSDDLVELLRVVVLGVALGGVVIEQYRRLPILVVVV